MSEKHEGVALHRQKTVKMPNDNHETLKQVIDKAKERADKEGTKLNLNRHLIKSSLEYKG